MCNFCHCMRLIPKLFPGHVLGNVTLWSTSFVSQSPGTIADQWECKDLDRTTKTSDIGRKEFWYQPRSSDYTEGFAAFKTGVEENSPEDLRFKKLTDEATLNLLATKTFAENTEKKMVWAVTLYREWWYRRCNQNLCPPQIMWSNIEKPESLVLVNMQSALCSFVSEVCCKDGKEFLGEILKQIVIMIQLYLEKQGLNFKLIDDPKMARFRNTLDNLMKR